LQQEQLLPLVLQRKVAAMLENRRLHARPLVPAQHNVAIAKELGSQVKDEVVHLHVTVLHTWWQDARAQ
jgi:hypothetical protein